MKKGKHKEGENRLMRLTERQIQIIQSVDRTGNISETARLLNISRQRVHQVVANYRRPKKQTHDYPDYYKDTGCDEYPSCLNCPLEKCKYDH